ncbi:MAG: CatA-like O-acetyltransferase [Gemmatimonadota bacterium]|nr:CatA-like O-acetyltransferase [Gemmatimonadota bacterium]
MSGPRRLDLDAWERREHFAFFRDYDQPFFNLCAEVDVSSALARCRGGGGPSFSVTVLFHSTAAANGVEAFRYRIRGDGVVVHDVIHAGTTVLRPDGTFGFAYVDYEGSLEAFAEAAEEAFVSARRSDRALDPRDERDDLIHHTVIPWIAFTSMAHARRHDPEDSVPKISFGRYHGDEGAERMPVSVEVHHALMDALHVGRFLDSFQERLDG